MAFKRILVAHDGSNNSNIAFRKALEIAKQHGSAVLIVTCLSIPDIGGWYIDGRINKEVIKKSKTHVREVMDQLEIIANKKSIPVTSHILETNRIEKDILSFAASKNVDLIVMCSTGRGKFDKLLLGSTNNGLVQKSKYPILIVK